MTILKKNMDRDIGNAAFKMKKEVYALSNSEVTKRIAEENNEWAPGLIAVRQKWLARQAVAIWKTQQMEG